MFLQHSILAENQFEQGRRRRKQNFTVTFVRDLFELLTYIPLTGRRGGLMVRVLDSGSSDPGSGPVRGHCGV